MTEGLRGTDDDGFTLIEILITMVILGLSVSAILAGLGIASRGTGATREVADANSLLTATAEQIEAEPDATYASEACPTPIDNAWQTARARAAAPSGSGATAVPATVADLDLWDGNSFEPVTDAAACTYDKSTGAAAGARMQRITLTQGDDRLIFIKRGPS